MDVALAHSLSLCAMPVVRPASLMRQPLLVESDWLDEDGEWLHQGGYKVARASGKAQARQNHGCTC